MTQPPVFFNAIQYVAGTGSGVWIKIRLIANHKYIIERTRFPAVEISKDARGVGTLTLLDAAQSAPHFL
jgi:hypothetical protein